MSEVLLGEVRPYPSSGQGNIFDPQQGEGPHVWPTVGAYGLLVTQGMRPRPAAS